MPTENTVSEAVYITLEEFATRTMYSMSTVYEIAKNKLFLELGIIVRVNPTRKNGGIRVNWQMYVDFVQKNQL